jgi:hypothetical protein
MCSATAMTDCSVMRIEKKPMMPTHRDFTAIYLCNTHRWSSALEEWVASSTGEN